ncbi:Na+/H+ antiporter [Actinomycetospora endophytica]|uniref:Na+/H+ antiporter n=1 Tax=Actinomycetospora endophytica TaxID=2291215 RepID=A0ABS8PH85_9PSEU|nr:Na+/H+ antiporter [Actinomycetospora endophytica]MCD2197624.1 Na+/H+ antiporter [Actinomycetospora endophytica]
MIALVTGVVGLVIITAVVRAGARRGGVPEPVALLVVGVGLSWVPGMPDFHIDPELVLVVVLPVLLYGAAFAASLPTFRVHVRSILLLSVGLTVASALAVGAVASALVPGLGIAAACVLGAVVAPPDAVAATAIARNIRLPRRVVALLEGESLFNDAAALTALTVAVGAVETGTVSFSAAAGQFLLAGAGGVAVGGVAGLVVGAVRARVTHPYTDVVVYLVAPLVAFLPAEELGASGLVAVVVAGLYLGHRATTIIEPGARVVTGAVGTAVSWLLEGVLFLLVGLQLRDVVAGIAGTPVEIVAGVSAAVVVTLAVVRAGWLLVAEQVLPGLIRRRHASWKETTLTAWSGMRGTVSLAAVLSVPTVLPDGRGFPDHDLLVFVTFVVILATLLGHGLTLPALARHLPGMRGEAVEEAQEEARARRLAADAALECLGRLEREEPGRRAVVEQLRRRVDNRRNSAAERLAEVSVEEPAPGDVDAAQDGESTRHTYRRYGQAVLAAERSRLLALRNAGTLGEDAFVRIQHQLDLEQAALLA